MLFLMKLQHSMYSVCFADADVQRTCVMLFRYVWTWITIQSQLLLCRQTKNVDVLFLSDGSRMRVKTNAWMERREHRCMRNSKGTWIVSILFFGGFVLYFFWVSRQDVKSKEAKPISSHMSSTLLTQNDIIPNPSNHWALLHRNPGKQGLRRHLWSWSPRRPSRLTAPGLWLHSLFTCRWGHDRQETQGFIHSVRQQDQHHPPAPPSGSQH